ncbi:MAG TPA: CPXCG motif-containing cysteine-rich protein [Steroidobacteraceae bacterium]|jgi:hypothetical protein|nr:CPXCG motif-containing cysteine-rich protein [Steroidobacteraceae bacterium]
MFEPFELQLTCEPDETRQTAPSIASRAIIEPRVNLNMSPPEKPPGRSVSDTASDADIDALYGLEPVIGSERSGVEPAGEPRFVVVHCPYCGEPFETSADVSAGPCKYVEDCQICCQPIEMELRVDENGNFEELVTRRGDS